MTLRVLDLFSGIGGFSLGLERAGMRTVAFCEIDPYCRAVLRKHWPDVPIFDDVRELHAYDVGPVDVICGGFPCQDISIAGNGAGLRSERSGLWSEYRRLIEEVRPRWVVIENVSAIRSRGLDQVLGEIAALGYDAEWHCIPASAVGAPHQRDRIWIVGYPAGPTCWRHAGGVFGAQAQERGERFEHGDLSERSEYASAGECGGMVPDAEGRTRQRPAPREAGHPAQLREDLSDTYREPMGRLAIAWGECGQWRVEPDVGRVANGVPSRVDRLRALGNAVVPQIPEIIGRAIIEAQKQRFVVA